MKLKPTASLQTTIGIMPDKDSLQTWSTFATVILVSVAWSPGKNTIVALEAKYCSASCAYPESMVQFAEMQGQDEHEVTVGVTQYTFSAEQ